MDRYCENCEHYKDAGNGIYGCELWECDKEDNLQEQFSFMNNGNISPCPYKKTCGTYGIGCGGKSFWCGREGGIYAV